MYKLLVVDDEFIERDALKFIITNNCKRIGSIEEASNGKEAIGKASVFQPDIVLMDIKMPGINGIEASKTIKQYFPKCRIALLTAFDYFDYAKEAIRIGVEDFIIKPATNEQVIDVVNRTIDALENERNSASRQVEMESKLGQVTQYLESELVLSILNGDMDGKQIAEYFSVMNIGFSAGFAAVIDIDFNKSSAPIQSQFQKDMMKKRCIEKLKLEIEKLGCKSLAAHMGNTIYALVLYQQSQSMDQRKPSDQLLSQVYQAVQGVVDAGVVIGFGQDYSEPESMHNALLEAKSACRSKNRTSNIVRYCVTESKKSVSYPSEKENKLCDSILSCSVDEVNILLDEIIEWMTDNLESMEAIRWRACELLIVLFRSAGKEFKACSKDAKTCFEELQIVESVGELKTYLSQEIHRIINEINDKKTGRSGALIDKVCEFIKQNYTRELSLEEAAGIVGLSNFYFSKMFKQYKNVNFVDYIAEVRINKSKELLKDPSINIKDIGELVGYNDPNYFTRVFKRTEGLTPTEYRNKKML
ncbi:MAG: response regulator [Clostridia bacterium]|nr:response regulator [Clostridia bacterium]